MECSSGDNRITQRELLDLRNSISRSIEDLAAFTATPGRGVTRLPFSTQARRAADYLTLKMQEIGLDVHLDASGAVHGRLPGEKAQAVLIGSHYDSVVNSGAYDGAAGVACALAIAGYYADRNEKPPYTIEVVALNDEEGVRFSSGFFSSRAFAIGLDEQQVEAITDADGVRLTDEMARFGVDPKELADCRMDPGGVRAYLEIHAEQGPVLEHAQLDIGVVESIVGIRRYLITIAGRLDHAGTAPMHLRADALAAAATIVSGLNGLIEGKADTVITAGFMQVFPNQVNSVAEKVAFSVDLRSTSEETLDEIEGLLRSRVEDVCTKAKTRATIEVALRVQPVAFKPEITSQLSEICDRRGYRWMPLHSGAGHDAMVMAGLCDSAMLFVKSIGGRSHCPQELCEIGDLANAAAALIALLYEL